MSKHRSQAFYEAQLQQDLFDALWLEDLYGFRSHCRFHDSGDGSGVMEVELGRGSRLLWSGRRADGLRALRVRGEAIVADSGVQRQLTLLEAVGELQAAFWWRRTSDRLTRYLDLSCAQLQYAAAAEESVLSTLASCPDTLLAWERLTCLKDRPFHPLARAKDWPGAAFPFRPESGQRFLLHWIAVPRELLIVGAKGATTPSAVLLEPEEQTSLAAAAELRGVRGHSHVLMPVHPWQANWLRLPERSDVSMCVDLNFAGGAVHATASLRSLVCEKQPTIHVKLSLSVVCLGATRNLPPRFLTNAARVLACLERIRDRDPWIAQHVTVCDEREWYAVRQRDALLAEPGDIACMIRHYPKSERGGWLVPMAALPAVTSDFRLPAIDRILGRDAPVSRVWTWFSRAAALVVELGLRCFTFGVMPELHGQNVLLELEDGIPVGIVLRDLDSVRTCPEMLRERDLPDPDYLIDRAKPQTLELPRPEDLLVYFQTLAIEVNLYAVAAAISDRYGQAESTGWGILRGLIGERLATIPMSSVLRERACHALLEAQEWPFKRLIAPLLEKPQLGAGMPSGIGRIDNPLRPLDRQAHVG